MPVPTAVPPSGSMHDARDAFAQTLDVDLDLRGECAELGSERDWRRVHEVRPPGFDDGGELA